MAEQSSEVHWSDQSAIRNTIDRYFSALDLREWNAFQACFSADAETIFHYGSGAEHSVSTSPSITTYISARIESYTATTHSAGNVQITSGGSRVQAVTHAVAYVSIGQRVFVRGLRYRDVFTRHQGNWVIQRRTHQALWQFEQFAMVPTVIHPR